jgi:PTS system ascorbate-specific IIA component
MENARMGFFEFLKSNGTIALDMEAADWKDAIRKGGSLLLQAGCCDGKYVEAMIDGCVRNGPYFVIGPGLAMPHARPENGVIKTGYALVTLKKGVEFGDGENDPVDVLVFMAAKDSASHTEEAMSQIAGFCDNLDWLMELRVAKDVKSVVDLLSRAEKQCAHF